jgi:hypothetical protein
VGRSSFGRNRKNERVCGAMFFEPLGVGHPGSERLGSAVVDGVADDRSADAKMALAEEATPPDFTNRQQRVQAIRTAESPSWTTGSYRRRIGSWRASRFWL